MAATQTRVSTRRRASAETMAAGQREISVSEFFAKNRHLLGFDNPRKALLTTVKEAVDNALDACEEAGILPDLIIRIEHLPHIHEHRYRVTVLDNGPGIVRKQVEHIFGRLLYGSKFHRLKMSRGQQGIGISAAGMYGLMTTGKPMVITTRPKKNKPAHHIELAMDTTRNRPEVTIDIETDDFPQTSSGTGTRVSIELEARYIKGRTSVALYLEQTAIANPHAKITFIPPGKTTPDESDPAAPDDAAPEQLDLAQPTDDSTRTLELADRIIYPRTVNELPDETSEIKPHPYGVELGTFLRMLKQTDEKQLGGFLKKDFCRITPTVAGSVYKAARVSGNTWLKGLDHATSEAVYSALQKAKLRSPPTDCLSPIGVRQMLAGLLKGVRAEFYAAATRSPAVYRGNPFQIEIAIAYGGDLRADQPARIIRFANRVPLLYQQAGCCAFKSVCETTWKNYGLQQPRGSAPVGPLVVMIHMASVWVPFTSESKEAIADYDEIRKEMTLALKECGRKLGTYIRRRQRMKRESEKRDVFERYIGEIAKACHAITGSATDEVYDALLKQAKRRTEIADAVLDEDGKIIAFADGNGRLDNDDGVVIIDPNGGPPSSPDSSVVAASSTAAKPARTRTTKKPRKNPASRPRKTSASKKTSSINRAKTRPQHTANGGLFEVTS